MKKLIILLTACTALVACKSNHAVNSNDSTSTVKSDTNNTKTDSANMSKPQSDKKIEDSVANPAPASGMGDKVPNSPKNGG